MHWYFSVLIELSLLGPKLELTMYLPSTSIPSYKFKGRFFAKIA